MENLENFANYGLNSTPNRETLIAESPPVFFPAIIYYPQEHFTQVKKAGKESPLIGISRTGRRKQGRQEAHGQVEAA